MASSGTASMTKSGAELRSGWRRATLVSAASREVDVEETKTKRYAIWHITTQVIPSGRKT
jgi:hypothetical protein